MTVLATTRTGSGPPLVLIQALSGPARVWHRFVRRPWIGPVPLDELSEAPFPKLVLSGGHHDVFEELCDLIAERLGAERDTITGAGHGVQRTGIPFNERLERFIRAAEASGPRRDPQSVRTS